MQTATDQERRKQGPGEERKDRLNGRAGRGALKADSGEHDAGQNG
jgi:hypothetical protein